MNHLTEPLLVALCIQIKDDYDTLMRSVGLHESINPKNYKQCGKYANLKLMQTPGLWNLQGSLIAKYSNYIEQIEERKYRGQEEAS